MLFGPHDTTRRCRTCDGFGEWRGEHVWCEKYQQLSAQPELGCSGWKLWPRLDDEMDPAGPNKGTREWQLSDDA